ncbi:MAG TPA: GNAT family N-acetyltransferase [Solirubrobacterales bacterium]
MLEWDTGFWGFPVARVARERLDPEDAAAVERWCAGHEVECAYLLADAGDEATAAAAGAIGFETVDTRVTLRRPPGTAPDPGAPDGVEIRDGRLEDRPALSAIARTAHTDSRFFQDPRFTDERAGEMYVRWIEGALGEGRVRVAERAGEAVGYLAFASDPVAIDLIAVGEGARGAGVGGALVADAIAAAAGGEVVVVAQERNAAATGLYESCGFEVIARQTWFHRWR